MMIDYDEKKILVVDDEEDIRDVLEISLKDIGYEVYSAENGQEAWEIFQKVRPSIVLTDIKMPGMDGVQLLRKIKGQNPETQVIMITGHGDMELAIESFKDDAADFITKPINFRSLEISLKNVNEKMILNRKMLEYTQTLEDLLAQKIQRLAEVKKTVDEKASFHGKAGLSMADSNPLFDRLPCYLALHDRKFRYLAANSRFKDDFRYEEGGLCHELVRNQPDPCEDCPVLKSLKDGKSHQAETLLKGKDGRNCRIFLWTTPIKNDGEAVQSVLVMGVNIQQALDIHDQLSSLGLMVGSVSHGLKGLLTGLDGGVYLLGSGMAKEDQEKIQEGIDIVRLMAGRIKNMVFDILFLSKNRQIKKALIDVADFSRDIESGTRIKLQKTEIELKCNIDPNAGRFCIDPAFIRPAMVNIMDNAIEACIDDKHKKKHIICFNAARVGDHIEFEIKDNGLGMEEKTTRQMFDMFFSLKGSRGTGLGLYLADRALKEHGGRISVDSAFGRGTCISLRIPFGDKEIAPNTH